MPEWSFAVPSTPAGQFDESADKALADYRAYTEQPRRIPDAHPDAHHPIDDKAEAHIAGAVAALKVFVASGAVGAGIVQASVRVDRQADAHHINLWVAERATETGS
ncbi:MAG: hypothetical protein ACYDA6_00080 [Solirubrobacteraceae bacterium]